MIAHIIENVVTTGIDSQDLSNSQKNDAFGIDIVKLVTSMRMPVACVP
jgi:hypothetical protein